MRTPRAIQRGLVAATLATLAACQSAPPASTATPSAPAASTNAATQAHGRLIEAFSQCNEATFVGAYAPYFSFTTSGTRQAVHTADGLRSYLASGCRGRPNNPTAVLVQQAVRISGAQALLVGQYRFKIPTQGQAVEVLQNFTVLMEKSGERWLVSAHHISVAPG